MFAKKKLNILNFSTDKIKCKKFYQENGFIITEKIFTEVECSKAISESKSFEKFQSNNFIPELMPHRKNEYFLKMMRNVKLISLINYIMNSDLELFGLQSTFFHGVPGTTGSSAHQDSLYVSPENHDDFISAWVALVDIDIENMGNLVLYPKSHTLGNLPVVEKNIKNSKYQNDNLQKNLYLELGVYKGITINILPKFVKKIYGFDSFEGLKEKWKGFQNHPKGTFDLKKNA